MKKVLGIFFGVALAGAFFGARFFDAPKSRLASLANYHSAITSPLAQIVETVPAPSSPPVSATSVSPLVPPKPIRAIYLTASTAKNPERLSHLIELVKRTTLTAMVINVKDDGPQLDQKLIEAVSLVRSEGIIPIARIVVFKDSTFVRANPQEALRYPGGTLWRDYRGGTWLDPASRASWAYLVHLSRQAADIGFEEINLDYVRFPTDGSISLIRYPVWDGKTPKTEVIAAFFKYFNEELKKTHPRLKTSLDIFGYTFLTSSGLNIGQRVEDAAHHFDIIAPMVYPSHYSTGNFGFENPAAHPYAVIKKTLERGFAKLPPNFPHSRIRPWLQAFDMGGVYNGYMLSEQIRSLNEFGITEFYLWNPRNVYDRYEKALQEQSTPPARSE